MVGFRVIPYWSWVLDHTCAQDSRPTSPTSHAPCNENGVDLILQRTGFIIGGGGALRFRGWDLGSSIRVALFFCCVIAPRYECRIARQHSGIRDWSLLWCSCL